MTTLDWGPILLSLKLSVVTTLVLLVIGIPVAWWLSETRSWVRYPLKTLVSMPLVLPPTVLGFYLLLIFSPAFRTGRFLKETLDLDLAFTFSGLVVGSVVFSLPFMINPLLSAFETLPKSLGEASYMLGKSRWETLFRVFIPSLKPALWSGVALTFAHTMGEFGVVLMIGGKIPGKTRVASMAIYDEVETLNFQAAHLYAIILFAISFSLLLFLFLMNRRAQGPLNAR